jgi:hypothetical protein
MIKLKIYYTLEYNKSRGVWTIFKNVEREHSFNFIGIYKGTRKECLEMVEKWNIKLAKN